jgi:hypothetical protein
VTSLQARRTLVSILSYSNEGMEIIWNGVSGCDKEYGWEELCAEYGRGERVEGKCGKKM